MKKISTCNRCEKSFEYESCDRSGKFCSFDCWTRFKQENRKTKAIPMKGYTRVGYEVICLNCGTIKLAVRKNAKYCGARCQLMFEYRSGKRDPVATVAAANASVRLNGIPKLRGRKKPFTSEAARLAISLGKLGKPVLAVRGEKHWNWKGGHTQDARKTLEYKNWRRSVFARDHYACTVCGDKRGGNLEADHIKPVYLFPELLLDVSNGRTLCHLCHVDTPTYGHRVIQMTREDFDLAS